MLLCFNPNARDGNYTHVMSLQIDTKSKEQGFKESRLPKFSPDEKAEILGSSDFLGVNFYTSRMVIPKLGDVTTVSYYEDKDILLKPDPNWYK